jgi:radical SAM-linked protein
MATDAPPDPKPVDPTAPRDKVRIRFRKGGDLRFLSHHDLMRTFERMLRRAGLPVRTTRGFHPKPRLVFALSLPLGVVGGEEVVELELDEALPPEDVHARLSRQAPPGLEILSLRRIPPRAGAQVRRLCYRLPLPASRAGDARARAAEVLAAPERFVERTRPPRRRLDIRPFLYDLRVSGPHDGGEHAALEMHLELTPAGTARPEEVLRVLGLDDLLVAGAVLERVRLELYDETPPADPAPHTPTEHGGGGGLGGHTLSREGTA